MRFLNFLISLLLVLTVFFVSSCDLPEYVTLTYDGNGQTGGQVIPLTGSDVLVGDTITVQVYEITREGYSFNGWNSLPDGSGSNYSPGSLIEIPSYDLVLYANWLSN